MNDQYVEALDQKSSVPPVDGGAWVLIKSHMEGPIIGKLFESGHQFGGNHCERLAGPTGYVKLDVDCSGGVQIRIER